MKQKEEILCERNCTIMNDMEALTLLESNKDSNGDIHLDGILYITDGPNVGKFDNTGSIIHVKDCVFCSNKDTIVLTDKDIFIDKLFNKIKVSDIKLSV